MKHLSQSLSLTVSFVSHLGQRVSYHHFLSLSSVQFVLPIHVHHNACDDFAIQIIGAEKHQSKMFITCPYQCVFEANGIQ